MRRRLFLPFLSVILLLAVPVLLLQGIKSYSGVKARSVLSQTSARVGDRVIYKVIATAAKNTDVEIPDVRSGLSAFDIVDDGLSRKDSLWGQETIRWYLLAQYSPGEYTIPKVIITYRKDGGSAGSIETNEARINVKSVLGDDAGNDFKARLGGGIVSKTTQAAKEPEAPSRDIDAPIRLKIIEAGAPLNVITYSDVGIICTSGLAVMLTIFFILRSAKKRRPKAPVLSPYEAAIAELDSLESADRRRDDAIKEAYSGIASALKCFLRSLYNIGSTELTTKEFLREVDKTDSINKAQKPEIEKLITLCDLVKFSGYAPAADELKSSFESARKIADSIHGADRPKEV